MAMRRISHPLSDELFAATKGDRTISNLLPVLGPPQMPMDFNVEDRLSHERWPVEKLYEGKNVYLENMLSTMVKRTFNPWVTEYIMPLRQYADINFVWNKWHANRTLAPQTAVGAPPERVTQTRTMERATMNRYELGFIVNAETLDNPEGQFALALDIVNVGMAIGDTFEQLGLMALLQRKNYWREKLRKFHEPYGNPADLFAWEKLTWDILRKDPKGRGFYELAEEIKKRQLEIISSDVILPQGAKSLLSAGAGNQGGLGAACPQQVFDMSENRGVFKPVDFLYALGHCGRFTPDGNLVAAHDQLARNAQHIMRRSRLPLKTGDDIDMFLYKTNGGYAECAFLGQMEEPALPADAIRRTAETIAERIVRSAVVGNAAVIKAGQKLINRLFSLVPNSEVTEDLLRPLLSAAGRADAQTGILPGNEWGTHDLPSEAPAGFADSGNYLPFGYGSAPGIFTIATMRRDTPMARAIGSNTIETAVNFKNAAEDLYDTMAPLFHESHIAFSGEYVPEHFASSHGHANAIGNRNNKLIAFAQNLLDTPKAPLYMVSNAAGGGAAGAAQIEGNLGPVDGVEADEQAILSAVRQQLMTGAQTVSPAVTTVFSSADSLAAFCTEYAASTFANAFLRLQKDKATDAAEKSQLGNNRSFALFATRQLGPTLQSGGAQAVSNLLHGVITTVKQSRNVSARSMEDTLATMAATAAPGNAVSSSSSSGSNSVAGQAVLTRLTHSPSALARAAPEIRAMFVPANFHDLATMVDLSDQRAVNDAETAHAAAGVAGLFAHSASGPAFTYSEAPSIGNKRSRGIGAVSGALPTLPGIQRIAAPLLEEGGKLANANLIRRVKELDKLPNSLLKLAATAVLFSPIKFDTFALWHNNDIRVPLSILGERPLRRYETASAIFAAGGEQLGEIAWAKFDVHVSSNAMTKDFEGNASIWAAPIIKREERYFIAEDVLVTGYMGGESLVPFSPDTFNVARLDSSSASVFYFLEPAGSLRGPYAVSRTHDIRGRFDDALVEGRLNSAARVAVADKPHHPSALFYDMLYNFGELRTVGVDDADYFKVDRRQDNTITHQTMQWMWNPRSGEWDRPILNTDHFGINIYEGHGDLRTMGRAAHYEDAGYLGKYPPVD